MTPAKSAPATHPRATHPRAAFNPDLLGMLAAIAAALLYLPAIQYGWVWDDGAIAAARGAKTAAPGFHPAVTALYRGEWFVGVGSPELYHFTSIALHALATWLFFRLARSVGASGGIAFGAALLFAAHPVHVEAVAYVTGRTDLLATACALAALLIARSAPVCAPGGCRSWRLVPAYALLAIAVLSDEVALVTPLILIALDRWGSPRIPTRGRTVVYVGFAAVALAGLLARIGAHQLRLSEPHDQLGAGAGVWGAIIAAYELLRAMVVPHLNAMRGLTAVEAASGTLRLAAIASFAALALFIAWRRKDPLARAGAILLLLPLIPALPLPPLQGAYAEEHAAYFASVGFCLLVAALYRWLASYPGARTAAIALAVAVAGVAGALTVKRIPVWKDNVALLSETLRRDPDDPAPHLALADQYVSVGNYGAAVASFDRAVALDSTNADTYQKRTILLGRMGRLEEAERSARRAVQLRPEVAIFWANLGDLLTRQGKIREASGATRRAVELDPRNASNWYNLGVTLVASDSLPAAVDAYRRAIAINPKHFQAINNLGAVLATTGRMREARDAYQKAVEAAPSSVEARMNLALASLRLGDTRSAMAQHEAIRRLDAATAAQLLEIVKQYEASKGTPRSQAAPPAGGEAR